MTNTEPVAPILVYPYWRDQGIQGFAVLLGIFITGWTFIGLAWAGVARTGSVPYQTPFLISGGIGGIALVAVAVLAWNIQVGRRIDAVARGEFETFVRDLAEIAEGLTAGTIPLGVDGEMTKPTARRRR